jgi:hypothetical protein
MMSGSRMAKQFVSNYLAADLPSRLVAYRNHWNLSASQLPEPRLYASHEPFQLDRWPTIITVVMSTQAIERQGYTSASDPDIRVTYEMRTYVWVRDAGPQIVTDQRDNLTTVVREALMDGPSLSAYDSTVPCSPKIDEASMEEQFSELSLIKGERLLAGAFISYELALEETITHDALGTVQSTDHTLSRIAVTPNAPLNVVAVVGDTEATLSWVESTWNGGIYDISGYTIQQSTDDGSTWSTVVADTDSVEGFYRVTGLANGTGYKFRVAALNDGGTGAYSASSLEVTPSA